MTTLDGSSAAGETAEEFSERMVAAIDSASLTILMSIGHQTGLLDTMAGLGPASSAQIADAAGLNERYVREWLGGMTTGHIIDYDAEHGTYSLPPHRAVVLTRAAGAHNLALVAQFVPLLGEVEQKIIGCFRAGGGLPYSEFPRFHALMAETSGPVFDAALVDVGRLDLERQAGGPQQRATARALGSEDEWRGIYPQRWGGHWGRFQPCAMNFCLCSR